MAAQVRGAKPQDQPDVLRLLAQAYSARAEGNLVVVSAVAALAAAQRLIVERGGGLLLAIAGQRPVGMVVLLGGAPQGDFLRWRGPKDAKPAHLETLWVDADARRRGAGRALVRAATTLLERQGPRRLGAAVDPDDPRARAFYDALGFDPPVPPS